MRAVAAAGQAGRDRVRPEKAAARWRGPGWERMQGASWVVLIATLATTGCLANPAATRLPTLGRYVVGESGADVLATLIPGLSRLQFTRVLPGATSTEHLPVARFRHANGDEIDAVVGRRCVLLEFNGVAVVPGPGAARVIGRFNALQAALDAYFSGVPAPRPRMLAGELPPAGWCPMEF